MEGLNKVSRAENPGHRKTDRNLNREQKQKTRQENRQEARWFTETELEGVLKQEEQNRDKEQDRRLW